MKTTAIILTVAMAAFGLTLNAQDKTQGKVSYEHTVNLHASLKPDQIQFKDMIPEFSTYQESLYFNGNKTKTERKEVEDETTEDGVSVKMSFDSQGKNIYSDGTLEGTYFLDEKEGKQSLRKMKNASTASAKKAEDLVEKVGKKTKNIIGFECIEVISGENTLWVTSLLPFKSGPMGLFSKHGAVLGMEVGKKFKAYATAIEYVPVKIEEVTIPAGVAVETDVK